MSLFRKKPQPEIEYLKDYIWVINAWFKREKNNQYESLRKVEDYSEIPEEYFEYYDQLALEQGAVQ